MNRWIKSKSAIVGGCLCFVVTSFTAQEPPEISFKEAGFSHERLKRIDTVMQDAVSQGRLAGLVTLVARHGRVVHFKAYGSQDRDDTIDLTLWSAPVLCRESVNCHIFYPSFTEPF